jgi:hypothetical protein
MPPPQLAARDALAARIANAVKDNERLQAALEESSSRRNATGDSNIGGSLNLPMLTSSVSQASRRREASVIIDDGESAALHSAVPHSSALPLHVSFYSSSSSFFSLALTDRWCVLACGVHRM